MQKKAQALERGGWIRVIVSGLGTPRKNGARGGWGPRWGSEEGGKRTKDTVLKIQPLETRSNRTASTTRTRTKRKKVWGN